AVAGWVPGVGRKWRRTLAARKAARGGNECGGRIFPSQSLSATRRESAVGVVIGSISRARRQAGLAFGDVARSPTNGRRNRRARMRHFSKPFTSPHAVPPSPLVQARRT